MKYFKYGKGYKTALRHTGAKSAKTTFRTGVILPHILQICVTHNISRGSVVNLNQLYQLLFLGSDGLFLRDQYFPNPNAQHRHIQQIMGTMVQISIKCMQQSRSKNHPSAALYPHIFHR